MASENPVEPSAPAPAEGPKTAEHLKELLQSANLDYSRKQYESASETYSQAAELQDELNGEMAPENAELLYLYGRCLFKVAVAKSNVLGGSAVNEKTSVAKIGEDEYVQGTSGNAVQFDVADDEEEWEEEGEEDGDEDDDFATAYEILEMARVLFEKQLEALKSVPRDESGETKGKSKASDEMTPEIRHITERLADTHDWQAEISLENERFQDAADESRSMLKLRQQIFPEESQFVAEGHYKLALALEFAFFTAVREAKEAEAEGNGAATGKKDDVDPKMLYEAIEELVLAVQSCEARIASEEKTLSTLSEDAASKKKKDIEDVKEIVQDMMPKVADLANTLTSISPNLTLSSIFTSSILAVLEAARKVAPQPENLASVGLDTEVTGTAAQKPGETEAQRQARVQAATAQAKDLTGLVRKKKPVEANGAAGAAATENGKRKAEELDGGEGKKVKFDI